MTPADRSPRDATSRASNPGRPSGVSASSWSADPRAAGLFSFVISAAAAFLFTGLAGDEEAAHYLIARYAPAQPALFLSLVGRPLVTLALALPSQAGLIAARLASAMAAGLAAWAVARVLARTRWLPPAWGIPLLFIQPLFLAHAATAMTEPWTAAFLAWGIAFWVERRLTALAVVAALLPLSRLELVAVWPFVALALVREGRWRPALLLLVPLPLWNVLGALTSGDLFWLVHQAEWRPYPERPPWHYLQCFAWITGAGLLAPLLLGATRAGRILLGRPEPAPTGRKDQAAPEATRRALAASVLVLILYLLVYTTLAWWRPITFGNLRYFASAAPALALLAAAGIDAVSRQRALWIWIVLVLTLAAALLAWNRILFEDSVVLDRRDWLPALGVALVMAFHPMPPAWRSRVRYAVIFAGFLSLGLAHPGTLHLRPTPEEDLVSRLVGRIRSSVTPGSAIFSAHPLVPFYLGQNPYDRSIYPPVTPAVITGAPPGALLIWDGHYTAGRLDLPPQKMLAAPGWKFETAEVARDSLWAVGAFRRTGEGRAARSPEVGDPRSWLAAARQAWAGIPRARGLVLADPGNDAWWRLLARRYRLADMPEASANAGVRARHLDPGDPDNDAFEAESFRDRRRLDEALDAIRRALSARPQDGDFNFAAAVILLDMKRPAEARPHIERALARLPRRADVQSVAGRLYLNLGDWTAALECFERALRLDPGRLDVLMYAGEAAAQQGDFGGSEEFLRELVKRDPRNPRSYTVLGDFLNRLGRPEDARQVWAKGLAATGGDSGLAARLKTPYFTSPAAGPAPGAPADSSRRRTR